ncbi:MAG TPA: glycosyltransferase [Allosphingosinicella sp.]|nr:glycosyltransferase [Allosphingosinicella sp.]
MTILAAIVTHNRSALLERCIDQVLAQTRPPDGLMVINNGSTDDTEAMLRRRGVPFITQPNAGGAGGFNRAIRYALENGFDSVWLMDDDGYPDVGALAILAELMVEGVACASSVILREDQHSHLVFPFPVLGPEGHPVLFAWPRKIHTLAKLKAARPDGTYPIASMFNGALVSTDAVRRVGNVDTSFFIFGDEVDFGIRLRSCGRTLSHVDARHYHPAVEKRPLTDLKVYYFIKNTFIINDRYYDRPRLRNLLTIIIILFRVTARNGLKQGLSFAVGRRNALVRKAMTRGLRRQIGADFDS